MLDCHINQEREQVNHQSNTLFLLRRSNSNSTGSLQVDFTPLNQKAQCIETPTKTLPVFNQDRKFYTPAFILEIDQARCIENQQSYKNLYVQKAAYIAEQKRELLIPKPSKNNSYCCVCKMPFDDYLGHLRILKHRRLVKQSEYNQKISSLCKAFQKVTGQNKESNKKRGRPSKLNKAKPISKSCLTKTLKSKDTSVQDSLKASQMQIQIMI